MKFEYFPQPDPNVTVSPHLRKKVLGKVQRYDRQRRLGKAGTAVAVVLLLLSLFLIARARFSSAVSHSLQTPQMATPPKAKPTPVPVPAPVPVPDPVLPHTDSTGTVYVKDPHRPLIVPHPKKYRMNNDDGTTEIKDWPDDRQ